MSLWKNRLGLRLALACVVLVLPMLTACAKSERAADGRVGASHLSGLAK